MGHVPGSYHPLPLLFLAGILEAVARDFFDSEVTLEILNQNVEEERTGKKEHVVFFILQTEKEAEINIKEKATPACEDLQEGTEVLKLVL